MRLKCACGKIYEKNSDFTCECGHAFRFPPKKCSVNLQPIIQQNQTGIVAVSSLKNDDREGECIKSWSLFGLEPKILDHKRPTIYELIKYGRSFSDDIILINSDIELRGSNEKLLSIRNERKLGIGKRWNQSENGELSEEQWGMDLFFIPKDLEIEDIGFRIGQPLWDYWIVWYSTTVKKRQIDWMPNRQLIHKDHPKRWNSEDTDRSIRLFEKHHGYVDWVRWRSNLCPLKINGAIAWNAIHSYYQDGEWDPKKCSEWYYNQWKPMIPSYGCECTSEFKKIELENHPDFSSQEKFYNWGVKVHNLVNKRLGKPQWTASTEKN